MASSTASTVVSRRNAVLAGGAAGLLALGRGQPARAENNSQLEANKELVRRVFVEVVNAGNVGVLAELYAPGFVDRDTSVRHAPRAAGLPLPLETFRSAFPSVSTSVEIAVAEGDLVAIQGTWRDGHPPAGTHTIGRTMHLFRIAGGQIIEQWSAGWEWLFLLVERRGPGAVNPFMGNDPASG